jgi:hypothetical protein
MIEIFTFLEKNKDDILKEWASRVKTERPAYQELTDKFTDSLLKEIYESYGDCLVTGETSTLETTFRPLCRVLALRGSKLSDVFDLPLILAPVIRKFLVDEYSYNEDPKEAFEKLNNALEHTDRTAHKAACTLLDVYQNLLQKRVENHNSYLTRMQNEFDVNLTPFRIEPEE